MRTMVLPGLLDTVLRNLVPRRPHVAVYEMGLVFLPRPDAPRPPSPSLAGRPTDAELALWTPASRTRWCTSPRC